jgi:hypothetical protein
MTGLSRMGTSSLSPDALESPISKNQAKLDNPDQLILQDLSDSGECREAVESRGGH